MIGPPTRNIESGSGGDNAAPNRIAINQIIPLFSVILFLLITPVLSNNNETKGVWKLTIEPKNRPTMKLIQDFNLQVEESPAVLASCDKYSNNIGINIS